MIAHGVSGSYFSKFDGRAYWSSVPPFPAILLVTREMVVVDLDDETSVDQFRSDWFTEEAHCVPEILECKRPIEVADAIAVLAMQDRYLGQ